MSDRRLLMMEVCRDRASMNRFADRFVSILRAASMLNINIIDSKRESPCADLMSSMLSLEYRR